MKIDYYYGALLIITGVLAFVVGVAWSNASQQMIEKKLENNPKLAKWSPIIYASVVTSFVIVIIIIYSITKYWIYPSRFTCQKCNVTRYNPISFLYSL